MQRLFLIGILFISQSALAQNYTAINNVAQHDTSENIIHTNLWSGPDTFTYNGNFFENSIHKMDTVKVVDPESGKEEIVVWESYAYPVKMNGITIYNTEEDTSRPFKKAVKEELLFITYSLKTLLQELNDGYYSLRVNNIVVDGNGKVIYYDLYGLVSFLKQPLKTEIDKRLNDLFSKIKKWPVYKVHDKPCPYLVSYNQTVYVYNHSMRL